MNEQLNINPQHILADARVARQRALDVAAKLENRDDDVTHFDALVAILEAQAAILDTISRPMAGQLHAHQQRITPAIIRPINGGDR